jgi:multiple sugar transport system substrate-binding protein
MPIMRRTALALAALGLALATGSTFAADRPLRVFIGGQQRPDVVRPLLDRYEQQNPGTKVELEVGGATSEMQQQYLTTVMSAKDSAIDVMLIDIIRSAQYAATGWAEPLDPYLGQEKEAVLGQYLPVYREANQVDGKLVALPAFADAMFLFYRRDLLEKHGLQPPRSWEEVVSQAKTILAAENNPNLQGVSFQGKAIEGAVCTFLVPYWAAGGTLPEPRSRFRLDREAAEKSFDLWTGMIEEGVAKKNIAEVATDDTRKEFQAGNAVFAVLWAYGWNRFQGDPDSAVKGKVGVVPLPGFAGKEPATCIGGWQWAVSAYSSQKEEAVKLARFLAGPEASQHLAIHASNLPVLPGLYDDPGVLQANPWFAEAEAVVESARSRPSSPRYPEVSETIRTNVNAVLAGVKSADEAIEDMEARLGRILR